MKQRLALVPTFAIALLAWGGLGRAAEPGGKENKSAANKAAKPIKALMITGGCCHDYTRQKLILSQGISARADVEWTIVQQGGKTTNTKIPVYENPDWAKGYDVVVHNECFAAVKDVEWVERILKPHREGVPAVLIHCAMHCYRTGDDRWFEFCGVQSPRHGPHHAFTVENLKQDHPIMRGFGEKWTTPKGELYYSVKVFPTAAPLAHAPRKSDNKPQVCIWTNQYGKTRVFATTIGHHNETMVEPTYLNMLTRGLLWAAGRLDENDIRKTDRATDDKIRALATAKVAEPTAAPKQATSAKLNTENNLALGKPTKASSEETGKNNFARHAVDASLNSRWCAAGAQPGSWWQVDLGEPKKVRAVRIHWEKSNAAYRYKVEGSLDGASWSTVVDQSQNDKVANITPHEFEPKEARYLRVTFLGSSTGVWGSFWEFEAYSDSLPKLAKSIVKAAKKKRKKGGGGGAATVSDVKAPPGFEVTLFGAPPEVNYPVCIAAAPTGEVFVGVDEQGSLGKEKGRGKVLRCLDTNGDGSADKINVFAKMDHPRGLIYDNGSLWVLHPPNLTVYHDDDRDGAADRRESLITGISTDLVGKRGADHTTNGIRMGIDGWIYIAVGDFGFNNARGADGAVLSRRGGGVVRVRPDGTEMEIYAWGLRNILDVCIDPYMNIFTRDNTNDGGGWDVRLSHVIQSARYGYPSLYKNFADEIMPPLADYGGGSGCGGMYLHDLRWPKEFADAALTCDWGRSRVFLHRLPQEGPTFRAHQEEFLQLPRPTDVDIDGSGRLYVASWKNGKFAYSGPNVGFVARVTPQGFKPQPFPQVQKLSDKELVAMLSGPSAVHRLHAQRELVRRGPDAGRAELIAAAARDESQPPFGRTAAIFTLKQVAGVESHAALLSLLEDASVREFALRALTDRKSQLKGLSPEPFVAALSDANPRVRAQALISLGRLGDASVAEKILPLTVRSSKSKPPETDKPHAQPDPDRVIPHLAVRALVALDAADACLAALDGPYRHGGLWALRYMHSEKAVEGLIDRLAKTANPTRRGEILATLIRLYHREGQYAKGDWWGTRPDTSGPYYDRKTWAASDRIAQVVRTAVASADARLAEQIRGELTRHKVAIKGLDAAPAGGATNVAKEEPITLPKADPNDPNQIANLNYQEVVARALKARGNAERGAALFKQQSCIACHTYADGQTPKGPHLVDIGKRYKPAELLESILKPSAKIAQGFDTYIFILEDGSVPVGFVTGESAEVVTIRRENGVSQEIPKAYIEERRKQVKSMMPDGLVNNLTPEQLADLLAYLQSLRK